jgi:hypothetical protein
LITAEQSNIPFLVVKEFRMWFADGETGWKMGDVFVWILVLGGNSKAMK